MAIFWSAYAAAYDTLNHLSPYNSMLAELVGRLELPQGSSILDAGCGSGNVTRHLIDSGYQVEAVDASIGMLAYALGKCPEARFRRIDLSRNLDYPDHHFAGISCSNVLYSLPQPQASLQEMFRVLEPGGCLVLSNPTASFSMGAIVRAHLQQQRWQQKLAFLRLLPRLLWLTLFNLFLLSRSRPENFYFPSPEKLKADLERCGFVEVDIAPTYAQQGWLLRAQKPVSD